MHPDDTIVAVSSSAGPGTRAIVRVSGTWTKAIAEGVFGEMKSTRKQVLDGFLTLSGVHSPLPATLYFFPAPHSYTGQDLAELHTISSPPLVERLLADLLNAGARAAGPGEFTQRAFLAGKLDLTRAEAVQAVIESVREDDLKTSLQQLAGNVARPLDALRDDLLNLLADVEAGLDFVDEDIEFVSNAATLGRLASGLAQLMNLRRQLESRAVSGRPQRVVLAGPPNAGKSSLFNALIGQSRAIVSPVPGTTRDWLLATIPLGGQPVELIDTAGLHDPGDAIDDRSQALGREQLSLADVVLWCAAMDEPVAAPPRHGRVFAVRTKCDLASHSREVLAVSSVTGEGMAALKQELGELLASLAPSPLAPSATRCRHHMDAAIDALQRAHAHALNADPAELLALELRKALEEIGAMVGAVYTNDLLDRIFSRFCIGK